MRRIVATALAAAVLSVWLAPCYAGSLRQGSAPGVRVSSVDFDGWNGCAKIDNGLVEAIVAPQIGRIVAFEFSGDSGSSAIFVNSALEGKTAATAGIGAGGWANFGGEKVWPSPQSQWPKYIGGTWPPNRSIDGSAYAVARIPDGVRLVSPVSRAFGLQIVRTITMKRGRRDLDIVDTFRWLSNRRASGPLGIWSVAQTRPDGIIFVPMSRYEKARFPAGFATFDAASRPIIDRPILPAGWSETGGMLVGKRDPAASHKVGMIDSAGWVASLYGGNIVFVERFPATASASAQPDGGCRAEVYTNGGSLGYIEIEGLGPLGVPRAGSSISYSVRWSLLHLAHAPTGDAQAASAVRRAVLALGTLHGHESNSGLAVVDRPLKAVESR